MPARHPAAAHILGMTTKTRVPKGTPEGGEFSAQNRHESQVTLSDQITDGPGNEPSSITADIPFRWTEKNVLLSPRHRKPVDVVHDATATAVMRSVSGEDAPVGLVVRKKDYRAGEWTDVEIEYREFGGDLYAQVTERDDAPIDATPEWMEKAGYYYGIRRVDGDTEEEAAEEIRAEFEDRLAIDGKVWTKTREPVYQVMTFGLGWNQGGTSLSTSPAPHTDRTPAEEFYFPANQRDEAIAYAIKVAEERGDDESIERIKDGPTIEVINPSLPGTTFRPAPRFEYGNVHSTTEETYTAELAQFRTAIASVPGAVTQVDDGFGGTTNRIDYSQLTERQAYEYREYIKWGADRGLI